MSHRIRTFALLALAAVAGCSQGDKKPRLAEQVVVGTWTNDSVPAPNGGFGRYSLRIEPTGMAEFTSTGGNGATSIERGTWDGADSLVRVIVRSADAPTRASSLLFAIRGRGTLGLVNFDTTAWGPTGLTLSRQRTGADSSTR